MTENTAPLMWAGHPLFISKDGTMDSLDESAVTKYDEAQETLARETAEVAAAIAALHVQEGQVIPDGKNDANQDDANGKRVADRRRNRNGDGG
jgi:hypothetical protein